MVFSGAASCFSRNRSATRNSKTKYFPAVLIALILTTPPASGLMQSAGENGTFTCSTESEPGSFDEGFCFGRSPKDGAWMDTNRAAAPATARHSGGASRFAVAMKMSSLGVGGDLAIHVRGRWNLRAGVNGFTYHRRVSDSGITYDAALRLRSIQAVVDWFPFANPFHISPGAAVYNGNQVVANAIVPVNKALSADGQTFTSSANDPVIAAARSTTRKVAPLVLLGFGNPVPKKKHLAFYSDFGVVFQGPPNVQILVAGTACDATGMHCQKVTNDKDLKSDLESGRKAMQQDLGFMRFYPILSFSIGYHF